MEGETWCSGSRLSDNVTTACICVVTEWKWVSLKKNKKKQQKNNNFSLDPIKGEILAPRTTILP